VRTDRELEAELADIDRRLDDNSAWLTPVYRSALISAREVVARVLARRREPWIPPRRPQESGPAARGAADGDRLSA
jgi:hypothetical protein